MSLERTTPTSPQRASAAPATLQARHRSGLSLGLLVLMIAVLTRLSRYMHASLAIWGGSATVEARLRSWDIDPSKLAMVLAAYLLALRVLLRPRAPLLRLDLPLKLLIALIAFSLVALAWAYDPVWSFIWTIRLMQVVGVYLLIIAFTRTSDDLHRWGHLFLYASFAVLGGAIQELVRIGTFVRLGGIAGGAETIYFMVHASWAVLFLPFSIHYLLWGRNRIETALGGVTLASNFATLYLTFRRAALLAVAIEMIVYFLLIGRRHRGFLPLVAPIAIAAVLAFALNPQYASRMKTIPWLGGGGLERWQGTSRLIQYMAGIQIVRTHPLGGLGLGGPTLWIRDVYGFHGIFAQHSLCLTLASSLGPVGLGIYLLFLASVLTRAFAAVRTQTCLGDLRSASLNAAILSSLSAMLFWAEIQPELYRTKIYVFTALGSVAYEMLPKQLTARSRQRRQQAEGS